jgi:hypothetical protein
MTTQKQTQNTLQHLSRMVDLKIPLAYLLTASAAATWALVNMHFTVKQLARNMQEVQITIRTGSQKAAIDSGELALIKYRVDTLEAAKRIEQTK